MKHKVMPVCGLVLAVALATQLSGSIAHADPGDNDFDNDTVNSIKNAVIEYQKVVDSEWTDYDATTGHDVTSAEQEVRDIRKGLLDESGIVVASAESDVRIPGKPYWEEGEITIDVEISTTKTYAKFDHPGARVEGVVTNDHKIKLSRDGGYYVSVDALDNLIDEGSKGDGAPSGSGEVSLDPSDSSRDSSGGGVDPTAVHSGNNSVEASSDNVSADASSPVFIQPVDSQGRTLNKEAMVEYAREWTSSPHDTNVNEGGLNPSYPMRGQNCANFTSQALNVGGWEVEGGVLPFDPDVWTYNLDFFNRPSWTWVNAKDNAGYVLSRGYERLPNMWNADVGDIIYVDWDGGRDGGISHAMVVTSRGLGEPFISQKSSNRSNVPLVESKLMAKAQGNEEPDWYAVTFGGGA